MSVIILCVGGKIPSCSSTYNMHHCVAHLSLLLLRWPAVFLASSASLVGNMPASLRCFLVILAFVSLLVVLVDWEKYLLGDNGLAVGSFTSYDTKGLTRQQSCISRTADLPEYRHTALAVKRILSSLAVATQVPSA